MRSCEARLSGLLRDCRTVCRTGSPAGFAKNTVGLFKILAWGYRADIVNAGDFGKLRAGRFPALCSQNYRIEVIMIDISNPSLHTSIY